MNDPQHILALLPNWLGDAAMATPALRALHNNFPRARITPAGRVSVVKLLNGLPWLGEGVVMPARPNLAALARAAIKLRPRARDLAVVFPHSFRAALLARLAGSKKRVGQARDGRAFLLTDPIQPNRHNGRIAPIYMADEYLQLVEPLGCNDDRLGLQLAADPAALQGMTVKLDDGRPRIGIAPGAAFGPSKRWPPERFAQVADSLADQLDAQCVLLTGPGEEPTRDAVTRAAKTNFVTLDRCPDGIAALKAAISQLDLLIGNDSGARHIAVAFRVPTVCIMGPTSPAYSTGPYERGKIIRIDVDCGPCQKPTCETDHRCMKNISPETVTKAAVEILK